ncbi:hypothetical protein ACFO26_09110 [Lactococcus nasutitermitis]|uniref:Prophage protein n=1 Tax=Lactococcus nasutitermitis TaxID=1652957 RepID=A0ABV9JEY2_9LACT|nr:hypothetical protein [Lactococcus nasutitermitis]
MDYKKMTIQQLEALEETGELVWRDSLEDEKRDFLREHPDYSESWFNEHWIAKTYGQGAWIISKDIENL